MMLSMQSVSPLEKFDYNYFTTIFKTQGLEKAEEYRLSFDKKGNETTVELEKVEQVLNEKDKDKELAYYKSRVEDLEIRLAKFEKAINENQSIQTYPNDPIKDLNDEENNKGDEVKEQDGPKVNEVNDTPKQDLTIDEMKKILKDNNITFAANAGADNLMKKLQANNLI